MNFRHLFSRQTINYISRFNGRVASPNACIYRNLSSVTSPLFIYSPTNQNPTSSQNPKYEKPDSPFVRYMHTSQESNPVDLGVGPKIDVEESEEDGNMTEFLSRFVWIMRRKLSEVYVDCDKNTIEGMLLIIVGKVVSEMEKGGLEQMLDAEVATPSSDFSEDLWKTVWEVSAEVLDDMQKARKKERMKGFLQSEEVKQMYRFAGEIGVRGEMLRELRFKWAREKMEESEFYEGLDELLLEEEAQAEREMNETTYKESEVVNEEAVGNHFVMDEEKSKVISLPKRHGKIKYKIYGLDLSDPKWAEVADRIHETEEIISPQEPKPVSGKCKLVTERILSLKEEDNPSPVLAEWIELLQPNRVDWINLLDRLKDKDSRLYLKVAELVLGQESFETNIRDYSKLIEAHAQENRLDDADRILKKMNENGILPDIVTFSVLVHMYSKAGELEKAKEAFENLRSVGFQPDMRIYNSMVMAYVNSGDPKMGESLMREMEARDMKPSKEIYMALLRSFAQRGDVPGAQRIATTMQFAGFQINLESCTLLVEAFGQAGDPDQARSNFDYMIKVGLRPDDRCVASMIAAYGKKNLLDKALNLLLEMEKDGFEPGVFTYSVLVDWMGKLLLVDEAEHFLGKIVGESPPLKVQVSLCDMYFRVRDEKKALQALGVLEAKKEQLDAQDFERIIKSLIDGGFAQDATRIRGLMEAQGFVVSEPLKVALMSLESMKYRLDSSQNRNRPIMR